MSVVRHMFYGGFAGDIFRNFSCVPRLGLGHLVGLKGHLRSEKGTMVISTAHVSLRNIYALWQCVQAYGVRRIAFSGHSIAMHTINQDKNAKWPTSGHVLAVG